MTGSTSMNILERVAHSQNRNGGPLAVDTALVGDDLVVVSAIGEIDHGNAETLAQATATALCEPLPRLVFDLSHVGFLDTAGLGVLATAAEQARSTGTTVAIVASGTEVLRMLRIAEHIDPTGPWPGIKIHGCMSELFDCPVQSLHEAVGTGRDDTGR
jgi:anti-anti-sigma factor